VHRVLLYLAFPALVAHTHQLTLHGHWDEAIAELTQAIAAASPRDAVVLRTELGRVLVDRGVFYKRDRGWAASALADAMRAARQVGDTQSIADVTQYVGQLDFWDAFQSGDWGTSRAEFERARAMRDRLGDRRGVAESDFYIGVTYDQAGQPAQAMARYRAGLAIAERVGDLALESYFHRHIGGLEEAAGQLDRARRDIRLSLALRRRAGFTAGVPLAMIQVAEFEAAHDGRVEQAIDLLEQAIDLAEASHSTSGVYAARAALARLYLVQQNPHEALSYAECALNGAIALGDAGARHDAEQQLTQIRQRL
jgi:tetratricopeptide (TPR) repeat protein